MGATAQIKIDTTRASQYYKEADSLLIQKKYEESIALFNKALPEYKKAKTWEKVASCYNKISENQWRKDDDDESLLSAKKALGICVKHLKNNVEEAVANDNIGIFYDKRGIPNKALLNYKKVSVSNHPDKRDFYRRFGGVYKDLGKYDKSIEIYNKALNIKTQKSKKDEKITIRLHSGIADLFIRLTEFNKAEFHLKKALEIGLKSKFKHEGTIGNVYYTLGALYLNTGKYNQSKEHCQKALELYMQSSGKDSFSVANTYYSLGLLAGHKGQYYAELDYIHKALEIYLNKKINNLNLSKIYHTIGATYTNIGAYQKADQYLDKALDITSKVVGDNHYMTATLYFSKGIVQQSLEKYDQAFIFYNKSLSIDIKNLGENHPKIARSYDLIGDMHMIKREYDKALSYYEKTLNIYIKKNHVGLTETFNRIGYVKQELGLFEEALQYFKKSLEFCEKRYNRKNKFIATCKNYIAGTYLKMKLYDKALIFSKSAVEANTKDNQSIDKDFDPDSFLDLSILLLSLKNEAEISKNIYLQGNDVNDLKNASYVYHKADIVIHNIRQSFTDYQDKVTFAKQAKEFYQNAIAVQLLQHSVQNDSKSLEKAFYYTEKSKSNTLKELLNETNAKNFSGLPIDLTVLEKELRTNRSFYQSKITEEELEQEIDSTKVTDFQNKLFDINRQQDSLTKVLEKDYPKYFKLKYQNDIIGITDLQHQIDNKTTLLEFFTGDSTTYAFTISKNSVDIQELSTPKLTKRIEEFRKSITSKNIQEFKKQSHLLYNTLLTPIKEQLKGDQLIIVPDGPLWHLNFELLLTQNDASEDPGELSYLLKDYAITHANSANLLFNPFKEGVSEDEKEGCLAFSFSDSTNITTSKNMSLATLRDTGDDLPGTRKEIRAIADIIDGQYYFGAEANEANFKKNADRYKILHLALHGEVDNEYPDNSKLFFTKSNDTIEDNLLYAHELFALDIPSELTVLSACNTGTGKIAKGEGIMSLGNAFQYAGTKSLLLSSWEVPDNTAPELMRYFYTNLKAGMHKGRALQQAKLEYLKTADRYHKDPFYWGGFYLVGDSAPIQFRDTDSWYWILGLGVLLILGLFLYKRKRG
ncbi:tetratricopeptide repeat protein [Aquimarina algiphila]|uniref:tetratricopeptide repeat protein n=1 Tax=Aquimarina algiphila TaxID=2047982 RepID=UPI002491D6C8|nr:tetratricopeptide repeat protein [Aquimarina algiphila]